MNYWHMNLHYTGEQKTDADIRNRVLSHTIGLGIWERENTGKIDPQVPDFKNKLQIGDVVLVLNGRTPIAVVEVIGDWYEFDIDKNSIIWYPLRRATKIIGISNEKGSECFNNLGFIPKTNTGTLGISIDHNCETYKYIHNLYECCKNKV